MLKKYLKTLILTSLVILIPLLVGAFVLWNDMADMIVIHWGVDGTPDGFAGKAFQLLLPSVIMLAIHWLCCLDTIYRNRHQSPKVKAIAFWICPAISLFVGFTMYAATQGWSLNLPQIAFVPMGILFLVAGNYMPKIRQNSTLGIKIAWTLTDEENWNATHRFGGKVWMAAGLVVLILAFLPFQWVPGVLIAVMLVAAFVPFFYSWRFYRKKKAEGVEMKAAPYPRFSKWAWLVVVFVLVILVLVLFTGDITYTFGEDALVVTSNRMSGITVVYDTIDTIELREEEVPGSRTFGYGSLRLLMGAFSNEEFGNYIRYTYFNANPCIVVTAGEKVLVLGCEDGAATRWLYQELLEKVG